MRRLGLGLPLALAASLALTAEASATVKVKTKTVNYSITGKSGEALLDQMDRRGPKHGFLTRAIAQTGYSIDWAVDWRERAGTCRVADATATLSITYTFPKISGAVSPDLRRRWTRFMAGVHRHEETHGRIARQMVRAAERSIAGLSVKNDAGCRKTRAEVKRRVDRIYEEYEARQFAFDRVEHAEGGNVDRLVGLLSRRK